MQGLIAELGAGPLTVSTAVLCLLLAFAVSMVGGALAAVKLAGKDLGNELAAMMGAIFGPTAAVPAVLIGLALLALF